MTIDAVFDGRAFLPIQPIKLLPNTRVQIAVTEDEQLHVSFLDAECVKKFETVFERKLV